jgi:hypothetical protein
MTTSDNIQIEPSFRRIIWYLTKLSLIIILLVEFFEIIIEPRQPIGYWEMRAIIFFIFYFIIILLGTRNEQKNNLFVISTYGMTGPSGIYNHERIFIEIINIDVKKTKKQKLLEKVLGYRYIYTTTNDKILINLNIFTKKQIETILNTITISQ